MAEDAAILKEFICKIHQFLQYEIQSNDSLSESSKESLTVASECINQAYNTETKPASNELFNIYKTHKSGQPPTIPGFPNLAGTTLQDVMSMFTNLASRIETPAAASTTSSGPEPANQQAEVSSETARNLSEDARPKKYRKPVTRAESLAADSVKDQGNDHMRAGNYQEAYENYTKAIEIDPNNAVYFSNRAAALTKLHKHSEALEDCREAIDIDPKYGKSYSRMGLIYASLGDHKKARDAYKKAVELEPDNESHRNNLAIEEEACNDVESTNSSGTQAGAGGPDGSNMMAQIMSLVNNPNLVQMAMRTVQDPRLQGVVGSFINQLANPQQNPQHPPPPPPGTS